MTLLSTRKNERFKHVFIVNFISLHNLHFRITLGHNEFCYFRFCAFQMLFRQYTGIVYTFSIEFFFVVPKFESYN